MLAIVSACCGGFGPDALGGRAPLPGSRTRVTVAAGWFDGSIPDRPGVIHVSPDGTDRGSDGSADRPYGTISAATAAAVPGDVVLVASGEYDEYVNINSSGISVVPVISGVSVSGARVFFPAEIDLSGVNDNGGDFVYLFRSRRSNNGVYQITEVGGDYVKADVNLLAEEGRVGNAMWLSAAIGRPVIVAHMGDGEAVIRRGVYLQECNFNILMGLTVRNSLEGFNLQNGGCFNVIYDNRVERLTESNGIQIGVSTADHPNRYNVIANNVVVNPLVEGIYIGAGGRGRDYNHTDFTHILNNTITTTGRVKLENAIDLKEYNEGSVVEGNDVFDITLLTSGNGAIDVRQEHDDVLIYGNRFEAVESDGTRYQPYLVTYAARRLEVFNNIFFRPDGPDATGVYLWKSSASSAARIDFYNNTVHNIPRVLLMTNEAGEYRIYNNIFSAVGDEFATVYREGAVLELRNNLYSADPHWQPYTGSVESGRIAADPGFRDADAGDFRLHPESPAIDAGTTTCSPSLDYGLEARDGRPDIGAWELR